MITDALGAAVADLRRDFTLIKVLVNYGAVVDSHVKVAATRET